MAKWTIVHSLVYIMISFMLYTCACTLNFLVLLLTVEDDALIS